MCHLQRRAVVTGSVFFFGCLQFCMCLLCWICLYYTSIPFPITNHPSPGTSSQTPKPHKMGEPFSDPFLNNFWSNKKSAYSKKRVIMMQQKTSTHHQPRKITRLTTKNGLKHLPKHRPFLSWRLLWRGARCIRCASKPPSAAVAAPPAARNCGCRRRCGAARWRIWRNGAWAAGNMKRIGSSLFIIITVIWLLETYWNCYLHDSSLISIRYLSGWYSWCLYSNISFNKMLDSIVSNVFQL